MIKPTPNPPIDPAPSVLFTVKDGIDRSRAPRGHAFRDALRHPGTQSVPSGVTTRSVGTIKR
mgnify:FL=1